MLISMYLIFIFLGGAVVFTISGIGLTHCNFIPHFQNIEKVLKSELTATVVNRDKAEVFDEFKYHEF